MRKLYLWADVLTISRMLFAALALQAVLYNWLIWAFLLAFGLGELTDALDGSFARKDPRPDIPNDYYWTIMDQICDILLLATAGVFVALKLLPPLGISPSISFTAIVIIAVAAGLFQIIRNRHTHDGEDTHIKKSPKMEKAILIRRILYVIAILGVMDYVLLFRAEVIKDFCLPVKIILFIVSLIAVIFGCYAKRNRLKEDKTPIIRNGVAYYPSRRKWLSEDRNKIKESHIFSGIIILISTAEASIPFWLHGTIPIVISWAAAVILTVIFTKALIKSVA